MDDTAGTAKGANYVFLVTCTLSHVTTIPTLLALCNRGWMYEVSFFFFALISSFMYHTSEALKCPLFLTELQWHRLDNIGAINGFVMLMTYLCNFRDPLADFACKMSGFWLAVILQERAPWQIEYTVGPIVLYAVVLVVYWIFAHRTLEIYNMKQIYTALALMVVAIPFFILGLDDAHDPGRIFHGLWHIFIGYSFLFWFSAVKKPYANMGQTLMNVSSDCESMGLGRGRTSKF